MKDEQSVCKTCGNPKITDLNAFFSGAADKRCVCDFLHLSSGEVDLSLRRVIVCMNCCKRVNEGRPGSFTQWVFRSDLCRCDVPAAREAPIEMVFQAVTRQNPMPVVVVEEELGVDPAIFPIERYKPLAVLARGAFGQVWKGRDRLLGNTVAIKTLRLTPAHMMELQQEARIASRLNHPNIVKVLDLGQTMGGNPFMVSEYIEGGTLATLLAERSNLKIPQAINLISQLCDGLAYAHSQGILHRDLKPANIMVAEPDSRWPQVKIADFGLGLSRPPDQIGTPQYMSPEQLSAEPFDSRSDCYAVGCILYETICGVPPYVGNSPLEIVSKQMNSPPPDLTYLGDRELAGNLNAIFKKCVSKNRNARYGSLQELKNDLNALRPEVEATIPPRAERAEQQSGQTPPVRQTDQSSSVRQTGQSASIRQTGQSPAIRQTGQARAIRQTGQARSVRSGQRSTRPPGRSRQKPEESEERQTSQPSKLAPVLIGAVTCVALLVGGAFLLVPWLQTRDAALRAKQIHPQISQHLLSALIQGGNLHAQTELARCYLDGDGVNKDPVTAFQMLKKSSQNGLTSAKALQGYCYLTGQGVKENLTEAKRLLKDAGSKSDPFAERCLGLIELNGLGQEKNLENAMRWFRRAAKHGDGVSKNIVAISLYGAQDRTKAQLDESLKLMQEAAEENVTDAKFNLGMLYELGHGFPKNQAKAIEWYERAGKAGDAEALYRLGLLTETTMGTNADPQKVFDYYSRAAKAGSTVNAQLALSRCYASGYGVATDESQSRRTLRSALAEAIVKGEEKKVDDGLKLAELPEEGQRLISPGLRPFNPKDPIAPESFRTVGVCSDRDLIQAESYKVVPRLQMYNAELEGSGLRHLRNCQLKSFEIAFCKLSDSILSEISEIATLENIELRSCPGVTKKGLTTFVSLHKLGTIDVSLEKESDVPIFPKQLRVLKISLPKGFTNVNFVDSLKSLEEMTIPLSKVDKPLVDTLAKLLKLKSLHLTLQGAGIGDAQLMLLKTLPPAPPKTPPATAPGQPAGAPVAQPAGAGAPKTPPTAAPVQPATVVQTPPAVPMKLPLSISSLTLSKTKVTDQGLLGLRDIKSLRKLTIDATSFTKTAVDELKKSRPDIKITNAQDLVAKPNTKAPSAGEEKSATDEQEKKSAVDTHETKSPAGKQDGTHSGLPEKN